MTLFFRQKGAKRKPKRQQNASFFPKWRAKFISHGNRASIKTGKINPRENVLEKTRETAKINPQENQ